MKRDSDFKNRKRSVDQLNEELYHRNKEFKQRSRRKIHGRDIELKKDFEEENYDDILNEKRRRKLPTSFFKKIFFVVLFFFLGTAALAAISLYKGEKKVSEDLISMEILGQPFIDGGEPLELQVRVQNFNERKLQLPDLVLSYAKDSNGKKDEVFLRRSLPEVKKGERVNEKFDIVLFGQEGDRRNIHATLEYRVEGSSSIFVREADHEVVIRSTPTQVTVSGPKNLVQNQELTLDIDLSSNTNRQINDVLVDIDYPLGFEFISSNIEPSYGSGIWHFQNLTDEKNTITIKGKLAALPGQGQSFHIKAGKQNSLNPQEIETTFNKTTHTIDVQQSFVAADLKINGSSSDVVAIRGGDEIDIEIDFKNTLSKTLADAQIIAHLKGSLYKPDGIRVQNGEYDSNTKRIFWNKNNMDDLEFLEPGESGTLSFALETNKLVNKSSSLVNPKFEVVIDVFATEINGKVREAFAVSRGSVSANSDLKLIAKTLHMDGPFKNIGPIPPRVGQKTQYTLTLQVTNSSNLIKEGKVKTFLPSYVTWLGSIAPSVERQKLSYNETTREILWDLGDLKSGLGVGVGNPKQVSFQVDVLPSLSHVGENLALTKDIVLSGKDSFTDVDLNYKKTPLTTLLQDPDAESGSGLIQK